MGASPSTLRRPKPAPPAVAEDMPRSWTPLPSARVRPALRSGAACPPLWCDLLSGTARPPPARLHSAPSAQRPSTRPPSSLPLGRQCSLQEK
uniref:Uncharacterized protein n=1 Tax=Triticum urartu TaxID=4572 RepID=A0A8R7PTU8_TRIUA